MGDRKLIRYDTRPEIPDGYFLPHNVTAVLTNLSGNGIIDKTNKSSHYTGVPERLAADGDNREAYARSCRRNDEVYPLCALCHWRSAGKARKVPLSADSQSRKTCP